MATSVTAVTATELQASTSKPSGTIEFTYKSKHDFDRVVDRVSHMAKNFGTTPKKTVLEYEKYAGEYVVYYEKSNAYGNIRSMPTHRSYAAIKIVDVDTGEVLKDRYNGKK